MASGFCNDPSDVCRLCHETLTKRNRRTIFEETFTVFHQLCTVIGYVPHQDDKISRYICGYCFTKLNKLSKIEYDINHRIEALKVEKNGLISSLRAKYTTIYHSREPAAGRPTTTLGASVDVSSPSFASPTRTPSKKHVIQHSPTPRKTKKHLLVTPTRKIACKAEAQIVPKTPVTSAAQKRKRISVNLFSPDKVKVLYRAKKGDTVRSKLVPQGHFQGIVNNISNSSSNDKISRKIYKSSLKKSINKCILKEIKKESKTLCAKNTISSLRQISSQHLATFRFDTLASELQQKSPLLYSILHEVMNGSIRGIAVTAAVALKFRNIHMTSFHHIVGQILDHGGATDETIDTISKMGLCISPVSVLNQKQKLIERQSQHIEDLMIKEKTAIEQRTGTYYKSSDIIGDNIDITRSPSQMSVDRKRKSWHWFLLVGLEKRILNPNLEDINPVADINLIDNGLFVPSVDDCKALDTSFIFHIMHVLVKYVDCLKKYDKCLPTFLPHPHIYECSQKSDYAVLDLLDKSENKSEDMISILEEIHEKYIPKTDEETPDVIKKKVFGGDVLTNERAYSAQVAMLNGETGYEKLAGVIHRPEGLHRMMNLLLLIYQQFYKISSATDKGTLSNLRNIVGRIDVHGAEEVIQKYRAHYSFMDDCLDAYIVAACMHLLNLNDIGTEAKRKQPLYDISTDEERYRFIYSIAQDILEKYIKISDGISHITDQTNELDEEINQIKTMFHQNLQKYVCQECGKKYKTVNGIKKHMRKEHEWVFHSDQTNTSQFDHMALYRASFMKCALLLRDTTDGYKMGDGNRILCNAKFQMLLSRIGNHTKYQLWLFRFIAYCISILTPRMAYEYLWNCTANLHGNTNHNIANDNLVELLVQAVKKKVYSQGANSTYDSVRKAALTLQIQEEILTNIQSECEKKQGGTRRPAASKLADVVAMVTEINKAELFENIPGREFNSFKGFSEIFSRVKVVELHKWLSENRKRLSLEMN